MLYFLCQFLKKGCDLLEYVITNPNKTVYLRLNKNGSPETCVKQVAQRFENSKARNILDNLPKTMKKFHFKVQPIPDEIVHRNEERKKDEIIISTYYTVPDSVTQWVDRVKNCNDLAKDAAKRKEELVQALSNADKDLSNCLHKIELTKWKNGCDGYKEYKSVKIILEKRRKIKDELSVVQSILTANLESMATNRIEKVVDGLSNRFFNVREVENYDDL